MPLPHPLPSGLPLLLGETDPRPTVPLDGCRVDGWRASAPTRGWVCAGHAEDRLSQQASGRKARASSGGERHRQRLESTHPSLPDGCQQGLWGLGG